MLILNRSHVRDLLPMDVCIRLMRDAMMAVSSGKTVLPPRQFMPIPGRDGKMGLMPGYSAGVQAGDDAFGVKIVSKYVRDADDPAGTHVGMVILFDAERGMPIAMMEGGELTAIRTAATSAMATDLLARKDAQTLLILGAGEEGYHHAKSFALIRPLKSIKFWARRPEQAEGLIARLGRIEGVALEVATDLEQAVQTADIICTTTSAPNPILFGRSLLPGQHVTLVGSAIPSTAEIDSEGVKKGRFFVDQRSAALLAAGELLRAIHDGSVDESHVLGEIGDVALGRIAGRTSETDITIYKSLGVLAQDLWAARHVVTAAKAASVGVAIDLAD
jgi:ornithine cyclodeaminase/alanine dehydrogenase-like protein (mu-crystallin family)